MSKTDAEDAARQADVIIRNTYRTLMTRGMKGCYVYATDKNLAHYLRARADGGTVADHALGPASANPQA
ncbi:MAG: DUF2075 domain-containing protein, partial [Alcaligenaceae bacterium]